MCVECQTEEDICIFVPTIQTYISVFQPASFTRIATIGVCEITDFFLSIHVYITWVLRRAGMTALIYNLWTVSNRQDGTRYHIAQFHERLSSKNTIKRRVRRRTPSLGQLPQDRQDGADACLPWLLFGSFKQTLRSRSYCSCDSRPLHIARTSPSSAR